MHRKIAGSLTNRYTKWATLIMAIGLLVAGVMLGSHLGDVKKNQASSWLPSSAEATKVANELSTQVSPNDIPVIIVFSKPATTFTTADFAKLDAYAARITATTNGLSKAGVLTPNRAKLAATHGVPTQPMVSSDGHVAYMYFVLNMGNGGWNKVAPVIDRIAGFVHIDGASTYFGGPGGQARDFVKSFQGSQSTLLLISFGVVILILGFTYRSPILWILPILCAAIALEITNGVIYLLAKYVGLTVNDQSQYILGILVIGAGTDYALLLIARYREELRRHADRHEAMAVALHRAAPAVIASAATVAIGLMCMAVAELNSTASLGPVLAVSVVVTVIVMVTLLPALLVILGRWMFWPRIPHTGSDEPAEHGVWARLGTRISKAPRAVWATTASLLLIGAFGLSALHANGLKSTDQFTSTLDSVTALKLMAEHNLASDGTTIQVVANSTQVGGVQRALTSVSGLGTPTATKALGKGRSWFEYPISQDVASSQAWDVVKAARKAAHAVPGARATVGGMPAVYLDTQTASTHDRNLIIPIILIVVLVILGLLLRAVAAPLLLLGTVILSFGAAMGISALMFKYVFGFAGADAGFPLFAFVFLVALGVDYNIFLMTRVREETLKSGTRKGSLVALASTGGVITSAGLVLAATFGALASLPMVFLVELGFAVALGVLLDTMIVRSVLVTALNLDLGGKIWWPSKLDRGEHAVEPSPESDLAPIG